MARDFIDQLQTDWRQERPDLDAGAMGVVLRIQALAKILGEQVEQRLQKFGLQWWQYDALAALRRQGAPFVMAATELATANMLTSGAMTNRIDRLENDGLVRRLKDPQDRRRVLVQLTNKGVDVIEKATEARFDVATAALGDLSSEQMKTLSDLLRSLLAQQRS